MRLEPKYNWIPYAGALIYGITTPIGIAAGLGVRTTYNPGTAKASIVSGVLDALSAGILLYTGLVEVRTMILVVACRNTDHFQQCTSC
jgi:zinc transporter 1/2/3